MVLPSVASDKTGLSVYTLGAGDTIRVTVFGEEDLSLETILNDAGSLSYPFLGELAIKGLTVSQLERLITSGLKGPYLIDPRVSVSIIEYRQFYVNGEVEEPGGFSFQPGMTLRKAVSLAGGFSERASKSKFFIISDDDPSMAPRSSKLEAAISPGDIIIIEQSFF